MGNWWGIQLEDSYVTGGNWQVTGGNWWGIQLKDSYVTGG